MGIKLQLGQEELNTIKRHKVKNQVPPELEDFVEEHLHSLVGVRVLEKVSKNDVDCFMSIKIRYKKNGKKGIILDGKHLSDHLPRYSVTFPSLTDIVDITESFNYACVVDISDMFYNLPIHYSSRRYLGLKFRGVYYRFRKAPLGVSTSCEACQETNFSIARYVSPFVVVQVDDFLVPGDTYEETLALCEKLVDVLTRTGLPVNFDKSVLVPTKRVDYLKYNLDFENHKVYVKQDIIERAKKKLENLKPGVIKNSELQSLVGSASAVAPSRMIDRQLREARKSIIYGEKRDTSDLITHLSLEGVDALKRVINVGSKIAFNQL